MFPLQTNPRVSKFRNGFGFYCLIIIHYPFAYAFPYELHGSADQTNCEVTLCRSSKLCELHMHRLIQGV